MSPPAKPGVYLREITINSTATNPPHRNYLPDNNDTAAKKTALDLAADKSG
jgi:hypothetical protein